MKKKMYTKLSFTCIIVPIFCSFITKNSFIAEYFAPWSAFH